MATKNRSCLGCGWMLILLEQEPTNDMCVVREHYCSVCDPSGEREARAARLELERLERTGEY